MPLSDLQHRIWRDNSRANINGIDDTDLQMAVGAICAAVYSLSERTAEATEIQRRNVEALLEVDQRMGQMNSTMEYHYNVLPLRRRLRQRLRAWWRARTIRPGSVTATKIRDVRDG
jgi:hypothetical protein